MSATTSSGVVSRARAFAPGIDGETIRRVWLVVVPRGRAQSPRLPFMIFISAVVLAGVVGLLCFNTFMQQGAFTEQHMRSRVGQLSAKEEAMKTQLAQFEDPGAIAQQAQKMGMVIPQTPALLDVATGKVSGQATGADGSKTPSLTPVIPQRPTTVVVDGH